MCRFGVNTKLDLKGNGSESLDWPHLVRNRN
jgi:hypothetical protein